MGRIAEKTKRAIKTWPVFRPALSIWFGTRFSRPFLRRALWPYWSILRTGEFHNFTYELTEASLRYLTETVAVASGRPVSEIEGYIHEAMHDKDLAAHIHRMMKGGSRVGATQVVAMPFGRRLGWYAFARAMKPRVIVETGVERGHGAVLLCSALLRNAQEGAPGRYFGTDINPKAGWLLAGPYASVGTVLYGDSIESLTKLPETIDLFINDSDHSAEYEAREYLVVAGKLSPHAIVLGDNSHVTDKLAQFARQTGRRFLYYQETPQKHWYPGAGLGIAYPTAQR
jgi:hypothetical protein